MRNTFKEYESVGPLCYLLTDKNDQQKLGLYTSKKRETVVLILSIGKSHFIIHLTSSQLNLLLQNKIRIAELANGYKRQSITDMNNIPLNLFSYLFVLFNLKIYLNQTLQEQNKYSLYPNYYYVYNEYYTNKQY